MAAIAALGTLAYTALAQTVLHDHDVYGVVRGYVRGVPAFHQHPFNSPSLYRLADLLGSPDMLAHDRLQRACAVVMGVHAFGLLCGRTHVGAEAASSVDHHRVDRLHPWGALFRHGRRTGALRSLRRSLRLLGLLGAGTILCRIVSSAVLRGHAWRHLRNRSHDPRHTTSVGVGSCRLPAHRLHAGHRTSADPANPWNAGAGHRRFRGCARRRCSCSTTWRPAMELRRPNVRPPTSPSAARTSTRPPVDSVRSRGLNGFWPMAPISVLVLVPLIPWLPQCTDQRATARVRATVVLTLLAVLGYLVVSAVVLVDPTGTVPVCV